MSASYEFRFAFLNKLCPHGGETSLLGKPLIRSKLPESHLIGNLCSLRRGCVAQVKSDWELYLDVPKDRWEESIVNALV